eukprot:Rmarinus@m.7971
MSLNRSSTTGSIHIGRKTSTLSRRSTTGVRFPNYEFYTNNLACRPDGMLIDDIHKQWFGDHRTLEYHHGFIQWLFPMFESAGVNSDAYALDKEEAKAIRGNIHCARRIIRSYRMMLDFYGMELVDEHTGEVRRKPKNWQSCYRNLQTSSHNFLRITRILQSLGELGFRRYKKPFIDFMYHEIFVAKALPACKRSYRDYWSFTLMEDDPLYQKKTLETKQDLEDSVFFKNIPQPHAPTPSHPKQQCRSLSADSMSDELDSSQGLGRSHSDAPCSDDDSIHASSHEYEGSPRF